MIRFPWILFPHLPTANVRSCGDDTWEAWKAYVPMPDMSFLPPEHFRSSPDGEQQISCTSSSPKSPSSPTFPENSFPVASHWEVAFVLRHTCLVRPGSCPVVTPSFCNASMPPLLMPPLRPGHHAFLPSPSCSLPPASLQNSQSCPLCL